jgi:hypothetical protein
MISEKLGATILPSGEMRNESERLAIRSLQHDLPAEWVILHNLEIMDRQGMCYELDLVVVAPWAVYAIEVKGWSGRITGDRMMWYFERGEPVKSPIPLASNKARILAGWLQRRSLPVARVPVEWLVLMSNERTQVRLHDEPSNWRLMNPKQAVRFMLDPSRLSLPAVNMSGHQLTIGKVIQGKSRPLPVLSNIGEYQVISNGKQEYLSGKLNESGLYTTYLATHPLLGNRPRFILKVYHLNLYARWDEREKQEQLIQRDARTLFRLRGHRNIVTAYPPFYWESCHLVLPIEWAEGASLRLAIGDQAHQVLSLAEKLSAVTQAASGLNHAHNQGVVHRDVRPDNLIWEKNSPLQLVNFDLARLSGAKTIGTAIKSQLTLPYTAPEVLRDIHQASPLSDQYALGKVLLDLFVPPNAGGAPWDLVEAILSLKNDANPALACIGGIAERALAFDPRQRYPNMREVILALHQAEEFLT